MVKFAIKKVFKPIKQKTIKSKTITKPIFIEEKKVVVKDTNKTQQEPLKDENVVETIIDNKKVNEMDTKDKITYANAILASKEDIKVKKVRKDKGLIERTESSKIILTEDNKELLND